MYHSIGNTFIHVRHIFNSHIAKLSMLLSKFQIFEFAFWDIENSLSNWICTSYDFSPKKEFALYFESRFFGVYFSFKTTFHKQVLYSSKTLNKLSCHHLFVPTQPYPRFAYFRPKPSTAEPARFSRAGRKTHCIPFASAHLQSVRSGQISSARCAAMCQPSARSADKMTFVFCIPFSIN